MARSARLRKDRTSTPSCALAPVVREEEDDLLLRAREDVFVEHRHYDAAEAGADGVEDALAVLRVDELGRQHLRQPAPRSDEVGGVQ